MRRFRPDILAAVLALAFGAGARAEPAAVHGRIEAQEAGSFARADSIAATLGLRTRNDVFTDLRLTWTPSAGPWSLDAAYEATAAYGDTVRLSRETAGPRPPPATLVDLTGVLADRTAFVASHRIDRLSLTYSTPGLVVRVGRQALTWGSGLVYRPMDLFNPFSPSDTDTEFKPGADMIYVQRLFDDGSDLQVIAAPRRPRAGAGPTAEASAFAAHLHTTVLGHQTRWLLARDHGDWVGGLGVNGALGGATWNVEAVPTVLRGGGVRLSVVANISDAVTLFGRNATVFAEVYHNGFGASGGRATVAGLPRDLTDRLARGQVFSLRRDYLAGGVTLEVGPLLTVSPTVIANLDDGGLLILTDAAWSLGDNLTLHAGAQLPVGGPGSEFGGIALSPTDARRVAPPARLYVQLRRYF